MARGSPRLGGTRIGTGCVQPIRVACLSIACGWNGPRATAEGPCPRCGSAVMAASEFTTPSRRRVVVSRERHGEQSADREAETDRLLADAVADVRPVWRST